VILRRWAWQEEVVVALRGMMATISLPRGASAFSACGPIDWDGAGRVLVVGPGVSAGAESAMPSQVACES
jgi:hypothetical protein